MRAERAAHLIDAVLPDVPVRQWVLTLPLRLRYGAERRGTVLLADEAAP
jgi:hypothetical protein